MDIWTVTDLARPVVNHVFQQGRQHCVCLLLACLLAACLLACLHLLKLKAAAAHGQVFCTGQQAVHLLL